MFFDTHAHITPWSHDAGQTIEELLADASAKNLIGICTADHYEKDLFYERGYEDIYDPEALFNELYPLRRTPAANQTQPALLIGTEIGWMPHLSHHLADLISRYSFDSVILSLHLLDGHDPYLESNFYDAGFESVYRKAIERMYDMVKACPDFDILGHLDYMSRYSGRNNAKILYRYAPEAFDRLFDLLVQQKKAIEINTGTIVAMERSGYQGEDRFMDPEIIQSYLAAGGQYITMGSDSHRPGQTGLFFEQMRPWLIRLGVRQLTYYMDRKPVSYSIEFQGV